MAIGKWSIALIFKWPYPYLCINKYKYYGFKEKNLRPEKADA